MADNLLRIAITPPDIRPEEAEAIAAILDAGWDFVHLRHPGASLRDMRNLIESIGPHNHRRLKLHGHFDLLCDFNLGGIHLNRRCPEAPSYFSGNISRSCHSIAEAKECARKYDYITLSPIFTSISKPGYHGAFTAEELSTIPPNKVVALGGITPERVADIRSLPFAGYAVLGYLWEGDDMAERLDAFASIERGQSPIPQSE
ncbi:thiamine phosphate synthase [Muribaculum intestinale]|uniref:thiamine phosphate synthase n=1 Tax=Muribaculum intestinale TaxID=1796646 RepID=UPI00242D10B2|nr:thiamine phosphate synthase [Muribaculum intestinale]